MTLFTSVIKRYPKKYLGISLFCFLFSWIYESFSHGVLSIYMMIPGGVVLLGGFFSLFFRSLSTKFYHSSLACFVFYLYLKGILEIYGTTNQYVIYYLYASGLFLLLSFLFHKR